MKGGAIGVAMWIEPGELYGQGWLLNEGRRRRASRYDVSVIATVVGMPQ
jgi:hypothetical protein